MGAIGCFPGGGGGAKVNGIVERYKVMAGANIRARDFVKYVNTVIANPVDTTLSPFSNTGNSISAVLLSNGNVFVAHTYGSNYYLYAMVVTFNGTSIIPGPDTQIATSNYSGTNPRALLLPSGNVFISYNSNYLNSVVVSIDGTTISSGPLTQLTTENYSGEVSCPVLLSNGDVFVAHSYGSSRHLYGLVVRFNGVTITAGSDTLLSSSTYSGQAISAVLLRDGTVFIAHRYTDSYQLYYTKVIVNEMAVTLGTRAYLSSTGYTGYAISAVLLPNGNVFVAHGYTNTHYLYGMVVVINGSTVTIGTDVQLSIQTSTGYSVYAMPLPAGRVFIAHSHTSYRLYGMIVTIDGTAIGASTDTQLSSQGYAGSAIAAVTLQQGDLFVMHPYSNSTYTLHGMIAATGGAQRANAAEPGLFGVAESDSADGFVDVYVPAAA